VLSSKVKETQAVIMIITDIQLRESPGSAGKSNDDIVYELAGTILGRLIETINADECLPSLLQVIKLLTHYPHNIKNLVL
jgi:dynein heavy chain